jgi:hypothetical protein
MAVFGNGLIFAAVQGRSNFPAERRLSEKKGDKGAEEK